jgi:hypothetical protein
MVKFYLDSPVSNSGRLKTKILECSEQWGMPVEVDLIPNVDAVLAGKERIVTGDSIILMNVKAGSIYQERLLKTIYRMHG